MSQIEQQVSLKKYNTFSIECIAENLFQVSNIQEVENAFGFAANKEVEPIILGGGSNVLFSKQSYPVVIINRFSGIEKVDENDDFVWIKAGAGEIWHELVLNCINNGYGGIENLSLIPGTVGAAPMQNIGAYGVEFKSVFESLEALDLETFQIKTFTKQECNLGYRESVFKNELKGKYFITSVILKLLKKHKLNISYGAIADVLNQKGISSPGIEDVSRAVIEIRQSKLPDPKEIGNAGSFFKNPVIDKASFEELRLVHPDVPHYQQENEMVKVPAGWLIEQCGWKGKRFGDVGVHKNQALVLVNYSNAKGADIYQLALDIKKSVKDKFNIDISPEVNLV